MITYSLFSECRTKIIPIYKNTIASFDHASFGISQENFQQLCFPSKGIFPYFSNSNSFFFVIIPEKSDTEDVRDIACSLSSSLSAYEVTSCCMYPGMLEGDIWEAFQDGIFDSTYQYSLKTKKEDALHIKTIEIIGTENMSRQYWIEGKALAKDIVNISPSIATPAFVEEVITTKFSTLSNISIKVLSTKELAELGMNGILSVGQAATVSPRCIIIEYTGNTNNPLVFIGKGITYDTGGLSLKTGGSMRSMKRDLGGAASVIGAMYSIAKANCFAHVVAILPLAENAIGATAYKPDDVITMANGTTVEVTNTDAEGRLILADALWYAQKEYSPAAIIDLATLTGACVYAVGEKITAGFSNTKKLMEHVQKKALLSDEIIWELPLYPKYKKLITSKIADIVNAAPEFKAGTLQAALFLQHFVHDTTPWVHLDIAFTAFNKKTELATACHVRTLFELANDETPSFQ